MFFIIFLNFVFKSSYFSLNIVYNVLKILSLIELISSITLFDTFENEVIKLFTMFTNAIITSMFNYVSVGFGLKSIMPVTYFFY